MSFKKWKRNEFCELPKKNIFEEIVYYFDQKFSKTHKKDSKNWQNFT